MPKVVGHTPPWLCRPSPAATLFTRNPSRGPDSRIQNGTEYSGPQKTLAHRGTEVFAVVENQIRWADLARLKAEWSPKTKSSKKKAAEEERNGSYRTLTVPIYGQIKQLVISPNGAFMAIVTAHTVHIAILPDRSHLSSSDRTPLRMKTYQLGPTTHVIPESPVVSAIWHPLAVHSNVEACIVTITADAAVRVWELDRNNHWSFDRPALAIDLKKLVDGTSSDEDFTPLGFGKNKGFSADSFDMEVASACFGGTGRQVEDAWAPMTLWIAMRPGDLYALCPLLPSKWQAPPATIPALSAAIVPKLTAMEEEYVGVEGVEDDIIACRQQYEWLTEIDNQDIVDVSNIDHALQSGILKRPNNPSVIPRLQGPFQFDAGEQFDDLEITDCLIIPARLDTEALMTGEDDEGVLEENEQEGLPFTTICISTSSGRVHICLELDGVEGQWLPKAQANTFRTPLSEPADLLLVESLDTVRENLRDPNAWPTFTLDTLSRYSFYLTTANNVTFISLTSWIQRLEAELQSEDTSGSQFRLNVLCDGKIAVREVLIQLNGDDPSLSEEPTHLANAIIFSDYDLGQLLLTYRGSTPQAAELEEPQNQALASFFESVRVDLNAKASQSLQPVQKPRRAPYQVPAIFYAEEPLKSFIDKNVPHRHRNTLKEPLRLSPSTLDTIAAAHRVLAAHTGLLEKAAADLFRRCERLRGEMKDQLEGIATVAERIKNVSSHIAEDGQRQEGSRSEDALNNRLDAAKQRQRDLIQRYSDIRAKISKLGGRPLSEKEKGWVNEVKILSTSVEKSVADDERDQTLKTRVETAKSIAEDLLVEVKQLSKDQSSTPEENPIKAGATTPQPKIPPKLQRAKVTDAMNMVERESAVIDAITARLERLNTSFS